MKKIYYKWAIGLYWAGSLTLVAILSLFLLKTTSIDSGMPLKTDIWDHLGSIIGGLVGALFSLASILLLVHTIKEQDLSEQRQKIESRFFELLKIHCDNLNQINTGESVGRYAIQKMVRELRHCIDEAQKLNVKMNMGYDESKILNFGYLAFYFGCALIKKEKSTLTFQGVVSDYDSSFVRAYVDQCTKRRVEIEKDNEEFEFNYKIFYGHQIRLSTYFRHIFHTVTFVNRQPNWIVDANEKYDYIKLLRAQLSPQEQSLIFYYSLSKRGQEWEANYPNDPNKQLITKYNLIRNILRVDEQVLRHFPYVAYEDHHVPDYRDVLRKQYT